MIIEKYTSLIIKCDKCKEQNTLKLSINSQVVSIYVPTNLYVISAILKLQNQKRKR